jgi:hypothetical protein
MSGILQMSEEEKKLIREKHQKETEKEKKKKEDAQKGLQKPTNKKPS